MKKEILYPLIVIALLIGVLAWQSTRYNKLSKKYDTSIQNNKAYESQLDDANEKCVAFQLRIDQLEYTNDKSIHELDSMRHELKIKDSKIKQMGKIKEYVYITDTLKVHDTIFPDGFTLDTCLGDQWYTNNIHLQYPDVISSTVDVTSDQNCFMYVTRETVNPPCKTWIGRLFQKKHNVYNVTVIENNPYINIKENKFIIIDE